MLDTLGDISGRFSGGICLDRFFLGRIFFHALKSLSSLLGDFFMDFWPGFLALDQNGDGTGRTGWTDGTDGIQFYTTTGTEEYSVQS